MAITDELRKWAEDNTLQDTVLTTYPPQYAVHGVLETLFRIADRIDEQNAEAQRRWMAELDAAREKSFRAGFDDGFASADDWLAQHEDAMREHGWIRLPKDVNGELVDIGDLVDEMLPFGGYAKPANVDTMELYRSANGYGWMVKLDAENRALISPKLLRHHKHPTVEDVLTEFGIDWEHEDNCEDRAALLTEYAAKLRLVESE